MPAQVFQVKIQYLTVLRPQDLETAFQTAREGKAEAVLVLPGSLFKSHRPQIVRLAVKNRLPAIYSHSEYVWTGAS